MASLPDLRHVGGKRSIARSSPRTETNQGLTIMYTILLIILILLLIAALPTWPYSAGWGYYPSGIVGILLVIILVLVLMGRV